MNKNLSVIALLSAAMFVVPVLAQDLGVSVGVDVNASASADASAPTSQLSSQLSSAVSSASSELNSSSSTSSSAVTSSAISSMEAQNCGTGDGDINQSGLMLGPMDDGALDAVATVTVIAVKDCSGLSTIDATTAAAIGGNGIVADALTASGQAGAEILAYDLEGTSLTVYVRSR